jgi:hypothetical protein
VVPVSTTTNNTISGWVMVNPLGVNNEWYQVGWIEGNESGTCGYVTVPEVFVQYTTGNGVYNTTCYPQGTYYLAQGTE